MASLVKNPAAPPGSAEDAIAVGLEALILRAQVPGIAMAAGGRNKTRTVSAGLSSARGDQAMSAAHSLPVSCVMKSLVALLCLKEHIDGGLDIEMDIASVLPELNGPSGIRLRHLLSHTGGYVEPTDRDARWRYSWERFVDFFPHRTQAFQPGEVFSYTHSGYVLLGKAFERLTGTCLLSRIHDDILTPLGIAAGKGDEMALHIRSPRTGLFEPMRPPQESGFLQHSISDICLSTHDLAVLSRFFAGCFGGQLGHLDAARQHMLTPAISLPPYLGGEEREGMPYAYGYGAGQYEKFWGLNGSYVGSTCAIRFSENAGFGFSVAVNAWAPLVRDSVIRQMERPFPSPFMPLPAPSALPFRLTELAGEYQGLMLGAARAIVQSAGQDLTCTVAFPGMPPVNSTFRQAEDSTLTFASGARDINIAVFPASGRPALMIGASAAHRLN